jgi:predicted RNase H-like HicB family nuclease
MFSIQYSFDPETKQFIASIPELHLSDYGDSLDEAEKNLKAMATLYFEESSTTHNPPHAQTA